MTYQDECAKNARTKDQKVFRAELEFVADELEALARRLRQVGTPDFDGDLDHELHRDAEQHLDSVCEHVSDVVANFAKFTRWYSPDHVAVSFDSLVRVGLEKHSKL